MENKDGNKATWQMSYAAARHQAPSSVEQCRASSSQRGCRKRKRDERVNNPRSSPGYEINQSNSSTW